MKKLPIYEVFAQLAQYSGEGSTAKKVEWLRKNDTPTLRLILKHGLDPKYKYNLPEGDPPFRENNSPDDMAPTNLAFETRRLSYLWLMPGLAESTQQDHRGIAESAKKTIAETATRIEVVQENIARLELELHERRKELASLTEVINTARAQQKHATLNKNKMEHLFIELLESLPKDEAYVLLAAKNKTLTKEYGITKALVKEAFPDLL